VKLLGQTESYGTMCNDAAKVHVRRIIGAIAWFLFVCVSAYISMSRLEKSLDVFAQ
jgi:hypothetical protein